MKKNDLLTLTADGLGADLEGVCRADGMAVFVPGMLPGETARGRIVKVQSRFAFGRMEGKPLTASPARKTPDCAAYRCGGCTGRHMTYETTLEAKRQQVQDCFRRIGHIDIDVPPVLGMADPSHYRNKTALPVGGTVEEPVAGFFAPRSHDIIPIAQCPNAMPPADEICRRVLGWMKRFRVAPYAEETHTGLVRHIVVRVNRKGEAMAVLVINGGEIPHEGELVASLKAAGAVSVSLNENRERTNVIMGRHFRTLYGCDTLTDELCGLRFEISPAAFFQVNPAQTEVLYQTALDFAELTGDERLCDVYCGAGTITLMMARHCREALGIEIVPQAIENAKENAVRNGIGNVNFRCGAAEVLLPKLVAEGLRPDVIVIDPPRKGVEPAVIDAIAQAAPKRVVYVSCNVATQARDAALFVEKGYQVQKVQSVDMFCWTSGVETVMCFSKETCPHRSVKVEFPLEGLNVAQLQGSATYEQIKAYVLEHSGLKVSTLYIAQVKQKYGIIARECYNKPRSEDAKQPQCPPDKETTIVEALKFYGLIAP